MPTLNSIRVLSSVKRCHFSIFFSFWIKKKSAQLTIVNKITPCPVDQVKETTDRNPRPNHAYQRSHDQQTNARNEKRRNHTNTARASFGNQRPGLELWLPLDGASDTGLPVPDPEEADTGLQPFSQNWHLLPVLSLLQPAISLITLFFLAYSSAAFPFSEGQNLIPSVSSPSLVCLSGGTSPSPFVGIHCQPRDSLEKGPRNLCRDALQTHSEMPPRKLANYLPFPPQESDHGTQT